MKDHSIGFLQTEADIDFQNGKFTVTGETNGSLFTTLTLDVVSHADRPATIDNFYLFTCEGGRKSLMLGDGVSLSLYCTGKVL